jgi:hypothetical protein
MERERAKNTLWREPYLGACLGMSFSLGKQMGLLKKRKGGVESIPVEVLNRFGKSHYQNGTVPIAYSYRIVGRGNKEDSTDDLREGMFQVNGAFYSRYFPKESLVFLAIVFGGEMYCIGVDKHLLPVNHVVFLNTRSQDEDNADSAPTLVDIVKDSYFEKYLDVLKNDMEVCGRKQNESQPRM